MWRKTKKAVVIPYRGDKSHGLGIEREKNAKKMNYFYFFPRRFWIKELRHSEHTFVKKRYTSIVSCVFFLCPVVRVAFQRFGLEQQLLLIIEFLVKKLLPVSFSTGEI